MDGRIMYGRIWRSVGIVRYSDWRSEVCDLCSQRWGDKGLRKSIGGIFHPPEVFEAVKRFSGELCG